MGNTDSIPVLSQLKSTVQLISGDLDGAKQTQENFRDTAPVVSQITSLVHAANGNNEAARNVQMKFAKGAEAFTDGLPVVGHVKGGIHYALGDNERGDEIMKGASKPLLTIPAGVGGFIAGGPAGGAAAAIVAGQAYDGIVTGIDTAVNGEVNGSPRYYGSWNTYDRIGRGKASVGEVFDTGAGIAFDGLSGAVGMKVGSGVKGYFKAVGREFADNVPGSQILKNILKRKRTHHKGKKKQDTYTEQEADIGFRSRCRRDAEFHLTADESSFVKEHLALEGGVGNIISADWRNMTVPDTVSNLVSLFVVLKLILWDDKNGRNYSRELCSYTSHSENEIDNCQFELLVNLRLLENQMQYDTDENLFKFILNPEIPSAMGNSSRFMIKVVTELFGILSSMGDYRQIGILWAEELCLYEQPDNYVSCEYELIERLHNTSRMAHHLGEKRKRRTPTSCAKRMKPNVNAFNGENIPQLSNKNPTKIQSDMVGPYPELMSKAYKKAHGIDQSRIKLEANHIPPHTLSKKLGLKENEIIAHFIPKDIHQVGMTYVGTSKNSAVARALRQHQETLLGQNKLDQAIALDIIGSYGRANAELATSTNPSTFRPALFEYRNDLHAVVNSYVSNDVNKIGRSKISKRQADNLHNLIEDEITFYNRNKPITVSSWFSEVEGEYNQILNQNGLKPLKGDNVPTENLGYGR